MLPPVNLLALDNASNNTAAHANPRTSQDLRGGGGALATTSATTSATTFADLFRPLSAGLGDALQGPGIPVTGQGTGVHAGRSLPQSGNILPLPEAQPDSTQLSGMDAAGGLAGLQVLSPDLPGEEGIAAHALTVDFAALPDAVSAAPAGTAEQLSAVDASGVTRDAAMAQLQLPPEALRAAAVAAGSAGPQARAADWSSALSPRAAIASPGGIAEGTAMTAGQVDALPEINPGRLDASGADLAQQATRTTESPVVPFRLAEQAQAKADAPSVDVSDLADAPDLKPLPQPALTVAPPQVAATTATSPSGGAGSVSSVLVPSPSDININLSPGAAGWDQALGERVTWMTGNKLQNAEIRLNPADLGPLRVQISVDDGAATINFSAQHPLTRDAIEQALPRLREMLADQGLTLGHATVSEHNLKNGQSQSGQQGGQTPALAADEGKTNGAIDETPLPAVQAQSAAGLVDLFA